MARLQHELGQIVYMPDPASCIWFGSIFPKKAWTILCKKDLDPILMAWSGFSQMHLVLKKASVQKLLGPVSGRTLPACDQVPTFRFSCFLPQMVWIILCKTRLESVWFWLTVSGFGQTDPAWKQASFFVVRVIWPASGQCFWANPDWMQIRSGMFTGLGQCQRKGNCDLCGGHFWMKSQMLASFLVLDFPANHAVSDFHLWKHYSDCPCPSEFRCSQF